MPTKNQDPQRRVGDRMRLPVGLLRQCKMAYPADGFFGVRAGGHPRDTQWITVEITKIGPKNVTMMVTEGCTARCKFTVKRDYLNRALPNHNF